MTNKNEDYHETKMDFKCICVYNDKMFVYIYILLGNLYVLEQVTAFLLHLACSNTLNVLYLYI